jgi:hypothetical protein
MMITARTGPRADSVLHRHAGADDGGDDAENAIALALVVVGVGLALEQQDAA